jgi:autotransporter-associated beta strand protein
MMKHLRAQKRFHALLMTLLLLLWQIGQPLQAATLYWDGSASTSWSTVANWSTIVGGGSDPAAVPGAVDDVIFNATTVANQIATLDGAQSVRSLTYSSNATTSITLAAGTSGSLALGSGGITIQSGSAAHTISAPISLTAAQTWTNDSASLLTISGAITGYSATNTLTLGGSGNMTISGLTASVSTTITKNGTGTVTIGGADPNFTGTVVVNAGVLDFTTNTNDFTIGTINNGGTLRARSGTNVLSDNLVMTINTGGTYDIQANDTIAAILGTGTVSAGAAATLTVNNATNRQFDGVLANGAAVLTFSKSGANTVILTNNSTYTGTTTVNTGNLTVSGANGKLSGSTTINIGDFNGAGDTLTLGAAIDVVSGSLDRLSDSAVVALRGGGVLAINGPASGSGGFTETILSLSTDSGFNTVSLTPASSQQLQLSVTDILRSANAATSGVFLFRGTNLGGAGADSTRIIASIPTFTQIGGGGAAGATNISILPWAIGDTSATGVGSSFVTHNGTDGIRPLTDLEYVSTTAGQSSTNNASTTGGETLTADATVNALRLTAGTTTLTGANTQINVTSGALLVTGAATTSGAGSLNFGTAEGIVTLANATGVTASLNARMTGSGNMTFSGSGSASNIIDLGGDNFFTGTLKINNGAIVRVSNAGALNNDAINTVQIQTGGVLRLNGNSTVIRNLASTVSGTTYALTGNLIENVSATNATLRVFSNADTNFRGILQNGTGAGTLSLIKGGGNTLTLHAANTMTGSLQVNGGTLSLDTNTGGTFTAITDLIIASGGTLSVAFGTSNSANRIPDALAVKMQGGSFTMASGGTGASRSETVGALTLQAGANTITGGQAASGFTSTLTFASLAAPTVGATVNFAGTGLGADLRNRITFTTYPTLDDNIFGGFATVGNEWATRSADLGTSQFSVVGLSTYTTSLSTGANPTQNVKITANAALTASSGLSTINSLNLAQGGATTVDIGAGNTLRVESGGILASGAFNAIIQNGTLSAGAGAGTAGNLYLHANQGTSNTFAISSVIANNGAGAITLTKTGTGQVNLTGGNPSDCQ